MWWNKACGRRGGGNLVLEFDRLWSLWKDDEMDKLSRAKGNGINEEY